MPVEFTLNGTARRRPLRRDASSRRPSATASRSRTFATRRGCAPDGNCRACMVEIKGERVLAPSCCRYPKDGMEVTTDSARALASQKMVLELLLSDIPETSYTLDSELDHWAKKLAVGKPRFAARHQPRQDLSHPAIAVNLDACIQCGALRARLPRGTGQRRHRLRLPRRALEDRVRPRRSDGRVHLRRLRRMRPGVPDRRAHARARGREDRGRQAGRVGLPVLRRRVPAHLPRQGQHDPLRAGQGRPGELEPAVRQGPLRLRLRAAPASPDQAADPQAGRRRSTRTSPSIRTTGPRCSARRAGRRRSTSPPRACARSATRTARSRSPASARPRARTRRPICSRSWCAPASARTTSTTARACATPRASPR